MPNQKYLKKLYKEYISKLENLGLSNEKLIICFAGIPCSGKTTLAKKIEKKYKGIRISNDELRKITDTKTNINKREKMIKEFVLDLLDTFSFKNKLIILDSGIERKYEEIYNVSKIRGWKIFIIKIVGSKKIILKKIKKKDKKRFEEHPEDIKRWFKEYKEFNKKVKPNFVFKSNKDLKRLFVKIDSILQHQDL